MKLSIIIPVYNEEADISECLKSLAGQSYKNFEIIIIDDGSIDGSIEKIKKFKEKNKRIKLKLLKQEHKGTGRARNLGAGKARGELLVFVDADMTFDRNYLKNLAKPLEDKKIIGATHELEIVKNTENIWSRCWGKIRVSKKDAGNMKVFRIIRKNKFLELGGFNPKYGYADDQTFWFEHKLKPVVASGTICCHKNPETLKQVYKQSRWIGASIDNIWINAPIIKYSNIIFFPLLAPLWIPILSIKKCIKNKDFAVFPEMLIFMTARYFGSFSGLLRKIFLQKNFK